MPTFDDWEEYGPDDPDPDDPRWYWCQDDDNEAALTAAQRNPSMLPR